MDIKIEIQEDKPNVVLQMASSYIIVLGRELGWWKGMRQALSLYRHRTCECFY